MWTEKFDLVWGTEVALNINTNYSSLYKNVTFILSFVKRARKIASEPVFLPGLNKGQWKWIQSQIVNGSVNCMKQLLRLTLCLSACLHGDWGVDLQGLQMLWSFFCCSALCGETLWGTHGGVWTMCVEQSILVWETWSAFAFLLCCLVLPLQPKTPGSSWLLGFLMWFAAEEGIWQPS